MSTLKTNTIKNTDDVEMYLAKAWVNFNGTGTVAIRAAGNVSSITDIGTGQYQVNFTTAMSDSNYSVVGMGRAYNISLSGNDVITTTAVEVISWYASSTTGGRTNIDSNYNFIAIFR